MCLWMHHHCVSLYITHSQFCGRDYYCQSVFQWIVDWCKCNVLKMYPVCVCVVSMFTVWKRRWSSDNGDNYAIVCIDLNTFDISIRCCCCWIPLCMCVSLPIDIDKWPSLDVYLAPIGTEYPLRRWTIVSSWSKMLRGTHTVCVHICVVYQKTIDAADGHKLTNFRSYVCLSLLCACIVHAIFLGLCEI